MRKYGSVRVDIFERVWQEAAVLRKSGQLLALGEQIVCPVIAIHGDYDPHPAKGEQLIVPNFRLVLLKPCPLILSTRWGKFLDAVFELADMLLLDHNDLVQKESGWMLKEASRQYPKEVFEYLIKRRKVMPLTAFRYALEKIPARLRKQARAQ